jgi:superfamily I DNA/RNA helicase
VHHIIEKWRNNGLLPQDVERELMLNEEENKEKKEKQRLSLLLILRMFKSYRKTCGNLQVMDFSDLILVFTNLLKQDHSLCMYCRTHMLEHLLADEYQDVNAAQTRLIEVLCRNRNHLNYEEELDENEKPKLVESNLMVVGDDYQAIHECVDALHPLRYAGLIQKSQLVNVFARFTVYQGLPKLTLFLWNLFEELLCRN